MALYRHKTWFWVQHSVDFQVDVSEKSRNEKEAASSRGIVLREAAHRGESKRLKCFRWKYVTQKLDTLNTNVAHTKLTIHRPHINIYRPASGETFNKSHRNDYRLWFFGFFNRLTKLTRWFWIYVRCLWYHNRPVFLQGNLRPTPWPTTNLRSELTFLLNWNFSFLCLLSLHVLYFSLFLFISAFFSLSFSWENFNNVCLQLCA